MKTIILHENLKICFNTKNYLVSVVKPVNPAVRKAKSKKAKGSTQGSGSLRIPLDPGAGMGGVGGGPSGGVNT